MRIKLESYVQTYLDTSDNKIYGIATIIIDGKEFDTLLVGEIPNE